jgi:hypothetical protein
MKLKSILGLSLLAIGLSSCGSRFNSAEELAVPVIHAIQDDSYCKLEKLQPDMHDVNGAFDNNKGTVGFVYYNKYTKSYRQETLHAKIHTCLDIINTISKDNKLKWDDVTMTAPKVENAPDNESNYSIVSVNLHFPEGGDWTLSYHATQENSKWYLLDDVYFVKQSK